MAATTGSTRFVDLDSVGLLALVRDGDPDAYGELYVRYHSFAHKIARRASRRHADDLVAESFRRVLTAISHGAGPTLAFGPYLATTIRSAAAGLPGPFQEVELTASSELVDDHGDVDPRVSNAYVSLPEQWQNALWYADVEGLSPRHAAPLMGLPSANAFSALRLRARAGLRSAYLTQVVDDACNEEVRRHLGQLVAGTTTAEVVDAVVDEHLAHCDQCGAVAWRIAAVSGSKVPMALAPALVAFHGFAASSSLLPPGLGLTGLFGWWRRSSQSNAVAAAGSVAVVCAVVVAGLVVAAGRSDDAAPPPESTTTSVVSVAPLAAAAAPTSSTTSSSSTTSTSTSTTTTTTTMVPPTTTPPSTTPPSTTPSATVAPPATTIAAVTAPSTLPPTITTTTTTTTTTTITTSTTTSTVAPTTTVATATTVAATTTAPTSTTTTTTVPAPPVGNLDVLWDVVSTADRRVGISVSELTGAPGSVTFSRVPDSVSEWNASCSGTTCTFSGVVAPDVVAVRVRVSVEPLTVQLRNGAGNVVATYTSP